MFFARITFELDKSFSFGNLSAAPIKLFETDTEKCYAKSDTRGNRNVVILEYGGFENFRAAHEEGTRLIRQLKYQMIDHETPVNISGSSGMLDTTATYYQSSVVTPYGMEALRNGAFFNTAIPENVRLENDYIGLKVFEVNESLNEIKFVAQNIEVSTKFDFVFDVPYLACWNQKMDISLSLLNVSIGINDIRLKFLLRLMAIETLASSPQYRDAEYMEAIEKLNLHLDSLDICPEYKQMLKSQLGQFKEQSISQKVTHLLKQHLSEKLYADMTAQKLFVKCYKIRSNFVHSGTFDGTDIGNVNIALKQMALDLLQNLSQETVEDL